MIIPSSSLLLSSTLSLSSSAAPSPSASASLAAPLYVRHNISSIIAQNVTSQTFPCADSGRDWDGYDYNDFLGTPDEDPSTPGAWFNLENCNMTIVDGEMPVYVGDGHTTAGWLLAWPYGNGTTGVPVTTIVNETATFVGRYAGGSDREQIYGTRTYGSGFGYPDSSDSERGVTGRNFPFFFWPIVWTPEEFTTPPVIGSGNGTLPDNKTLTGDNTFPGMDGPAYLYATEYGPAGFQYRPGSSLMTTQFESTDGNTTFRIVADNATTVSLVDSISKNCSSVISSKTPSINGFTPSFSSDPSSNTERMPRPEEAVQYYRASSIVLTLDGYNDTTALSSNASDSDSHVDLPKSMNMDMLVCINATIGEAAPLVTKHEYAQNASGVEVETDNNVWLDNMGEENYHYEGTGLAGQQSEDSSARMNGAGLLVLVPVLCVTLGILLI